VKRLIGVDQGEEVQLMENAEVRDLLLYLAEKHGEAFKKAIYDVSGGDLKANFIMTVNGLLLNQLEGVKTRLRDGDHVVVMPIVSGG
jgi:molybdopterin converting factor small subunit